MRYIIGALVVVMLAGCADDMEINGKTYGTYGIINKDEVKDPAIEYKLCVGNLIWSGILFETAIAPIYFIGFSIYEPVGVKQ